MNQERPAVVCLVGSFRDGNLYKEAGIMETVAGNIVIPPMVNLKDPRDLYLTGVANYSDEVSLKVRLDELHLRKIDLADDVLVCGYIGESTAKEIKYAIEHKKRVRWFNGKFYPRIGTESYHFLYGDKE